LHGAAILARPVGWRSSETRDVIEVARLVTDGTPNACSMLYAAAARAARSLGYREIVTYIIDGAESGVSLKASGWTLSGYTKPASWTQGRSRQQTGPVCRKQRWTRHLNGDV